MALAFFAVGALLAGVSNNFTVMLVGRSLQGVGGGGIISLTEIIVTDLVPLRSRGSWFGYLSSMWAIGSVSGPLIGGALAQNSAWVSDSTFMRDSIHKLTIQRDGFFT